MAKQQGSGVVAAARRVSDIQGRFQDVGGQFMSGYDKAMETKNKMEAKNQELQAKTNAYIDQFDGDVDLAGFSDEDKAVVKDQVITNRNEFIEGANGAAKIKDKTSPEYQMYMDKMNAAMSKMEKLRANLDGIANLKIEYANGFYQEIYSNSQKNSENLLRANAILEGNISSIGDDGSLNFKGYTLPDTLPGGGGGFTVEDFSYNTKSFKKPFTRIWIEEFEDREKRLRSFGNVLIDSGHGFSDTAIFFGRDTLPNICYISDLDRVYELAPGDEVTLAAECERESLVEDLIQDSLGDYEGYFSISVRGNSEDFSLGDTYASLKYDIECKLKVTDTSACFLRDQMTDLGGRLSYIMNGFLEYNYCDHPQNSEFISEVRDKYGSNK